MRRESEVCEHYPHLLKAAVLLYLPGQCGGFDIRFSIAASPQGECQIQNHTGIQGLLVSL